MKKFLLLITISFIVASCSKFNTDNNKSESTPIFTWIVNSNQNENILVEETTKEDIDETKKYELSDTWVILKHWKNCVLDECIPDYIKLEEENWFLVWSKVIKDEYWDENSFNYKLSKDKSYLEIKEEAVMRTTIISITKIWEDYIKLINNSWCWWSNIDQKVYDASWNIVKNFQLSDVKKELFIWNIKYEQTLSWDWWFWQPLDSFNKYKIYRDENWEYISFENEDEFIKFITNKVTKEDKKLYSWYILRLKKYPGMNIIFNSVWYDNKAIRVVYLWKDKEYLSKNIKENWDFIDLDITKKIISYYSWSEVSYWIYDEDSNRVLKVENSNLPFFNMKKLDENWNYLVYLKNNYSLESFAEMCKPVVYYYWKNNEENSLRLNLKKWDEFTKLIPELDENNSWNFKINNSKIEVNNKLYDYLYYSIITTNYKHNTDWWIVKWSDIVTFFEDKLEKINFNKKEKSDFIDFWKNEYDENKYYFVSFKYKEDLDKILPLEFSKEVRSEFRVLLDSYEVNFNEKIYWKYLYKNKIDDGLDRYLIKRFERWNSQNEVFEWWWVLRKNNQIIVK